MSESFDKSSRCRKKTPGKDCWNNAVHVQEDVFSRHPHGRDGCLRLRAGIFPCRAPCAPSPSSQGFPAEARGPAGDKKGRAEPPENPPVMKNHVIRNKDRDRRA